MNNAEMIEIFDAAIANAKDNNQADDRRLLKAYFTDAAARAQLEEIVWNANQNA